ncbi:DUF3226 domain-containing protein [Pedobacter miscanthi]|uniref:DUF3226 domain-containing protein n=1 Tax=Pedobacter miscanthi TaxID=2259170 RepID=UPI00292F3FA6|nr:DUF3226 domain-containing protein [Pedobacter miscanthi]
MITIFTEGEWDTPFVEQLLKRILLVDKLENIRIIDTKGYTTLHLNQPIFQETTDAGGTNLVIFDADSVENNGGYATRYDYLMAKKDELGLQFELFLFPNNHDDGMFETLLEKVAVQHHKPIIDCFESYLDCVTQKGILGGYTYTIPAQKAKIYAYVESVLTPAEFKDARSKQTWAYANNNVWDFDSNELIPLKEFLGNHIAN